MKMPARHKCIENESVWVTVEVSLPVDLCDKASEILASQGLTLEDALVLFYEETVRLGRIPFEYTEEDLLEARRSVNE